MMISFNNSASAAEQCICSRAISFATHTLRATLGVVLLLLAVVAAEPAFAQTTGPQQLAFTGLRAVQTAGVPTGQVNAVATDSSGNIFLLLDQKDGVRVLKADPTASSVLAQTQIGAKGDVGLAMALDPAGNVYVTGTTSSGALTATAGAAFRTPTGSTVNSFVARFDSSLNTSFITFAGASSISATGIAATADAVFITGSIYSATLPVTSTAAIQSPAYGTTGNGFVERFSSSGSTLVYATYLSGAGGLTAPAAIAADGADDAYIAGYTSASGFPTLSALVPDILDTTSGFLAKLAPAGDRLLFSTFIPGGGVTSLALDASTSNLLLTGPISFGQFPVATVQAPLAPTTYQVLVRMPLDASAVLSSTALAPGSQSYVAVAPGGSAWVEGPLSLPLFPLAPLASIGNAFAMRITSAGQVDQTARFGGIAATNLSYASAPVTLDAIASNSTGDALLAGSFNPRASSALLATQTFDLPLANAPTAAFPSLPHNAVLPTGSCSGSQCAGSAAFLARLVTPATASAALALSTDDAPNLTLRNLGSAQATGLQITVSGYTETNNCGATLAAGAECAIALSGSGPGSVQVSADNSATQSQNIPALSASATPAAVVFSPKELDFGVVSAAGTAVQRTVTISNLTQTTQSFTSAHTSNAKATFPYTLTEQSTDCTLAGGTNRMLAPGGSCHITLALATSSDSSNDGPIQTSWLLGARAVQVTAFSQAAALSLSATELDFGTQYPGGPRLPRYLFLSNQSTTAYSHTAVTLPPASPFTITDACPPTLQPRSVCRMQLGYQQTHTPATDSVTLQLDQGLSVLVTGKTVAAPTGGGQSVTPTLSVSTNALTFTTAVPVTGTSTTTQSVIIGNTGAAAFPLLLSLTGDFTQTTNCGATLAAGTSCSAILTFAPSAPGTRTGLLSITAGAGGTPAQVTLTGTATGILTPATNGAIAFPAEPVGQPVVLWYKIAAPFTTFSAATSSSTAGAPFTAVLVEDIGFGHGQPPASAFSANASGTCFNCWLGLRFQPAAPGAETGTVTLTSATGGSPYILSLTGTGTPLTGLLIAPVTQNFGSVPVNSTSAPSLFVITNLSDAQTALTLSTPTVTGDFALTSTASGAQPCGGTLAYTASCTVSVVFAPTTAGARTGVLTVQGGTLSASANLTGYAAADPGLALNPTALVFSNIPGTTSTQQTLTLTNTGAIQVQVATPTSSSTSFSPATNCGTLAPSSSCTVLVTYAPSTAPASGTLTLPITTTVGGTPNTTSYTVPLTGAYTAETAGLEILPAQVQYGPLATGTVDTPRQFTIVNLTAKALALQIALPRQFVLSGPPCSGLAPNATCTFSVAFLPLTNGDITGTLFATGTPTDGSATLNGIGYLEGYGTGTAALSVSGDIQPGHVLSFGQVPSGQTAQKTVTLTNTSATLPVTIRRITSQWPFPATSTCGATLAPGASCTVTVTYTPVNQVSAGGSAPPTANDTGSLLIESDALSSPDLINLSGTSTGVTVGSPSNSAPFAAFAASQSSLTFNSTQAGNASAPQSITLSNTGAASVHILGIQTTPDFTVVSDCSTIVPGASCTLTVTFTPQPTAQGAAPTATRFAAIEIASDASTPLEFVSVIGTAAPSTLALSQTALDFGTVQLGSHTALALQLTNTGSSPATFNGLTATGDYAVAPGSCPLPGLALAPATSCTLQITFAPTQTGTRTGTLGIATSASTLPLTVSLTGLGVQSHLQVTPAALDFGSVALGSAANLTVTLANTGTASINNLALVASSGYSVSTPCVVTALAPGATCTLTLTFTPTAVGADPGTLTITSSDPTSPDILPLTGTGIAAGSFTLTVDGGATGTRSTRPGTPATYSLTLTPTSGFSGTVLLTCTPVNPAQYAFCSLLPAAVTLNGAPQNTDATITTVISVASARNASPPRVSHPRNFAQTALALLFPALLFSWKARSSRRRLWRRTVPIAWAWLAALALATASGCGGGGPDPNLRYAAPGTYQYQVTATSVTAPAQVTQTVTLNLTLQ